MTDKDAINDKDAFPTPTNIATREYELLFEETEGEGLRNHTMYLVGKSVPALGQMLAIDIEWHDNGFDRSFKPNFKDPPNTFGELGYVFWTGIPDEEVSNLILSTLVACSTEKHFKQILHPDPFTLADFTFEQTQDEKAFLKLREAVGTRPDNCGVSRHFIQPEALSLTEEWMNQNHIQIRLRPEHQVALDSDTPA